jgi:hypothetical protein
VGESISILQQKKDEDELECLKRCIQETSERIRTKTTQLKNIKSEVSILLERKKNEVVSTVADKVSVDSQSKSAIEQRILNGTSKSENPDLSICELEKHIIILNKLSYCRIVSYKSSEILLNAVLLPSAKVSLRFNVREDFKSKNELLIDDINIELLLLEYDTLHSQNEKYVVEREMKLGAAYFANVLGCDEVFGCLSAVTLQNLTKPCDIPDLIHKVNIIIQLSLNFSICLSLYIVDQWKYNRFTETLLYS